MTISNTNPFPIDLSNIEAIWIDVDQTLLDFDRSAKYALQKTFDAWNLPWKEEYFTIFLRENGRLWDQIEEGKLTRNELRKIRFQVMSKAWNLCLDHFTEFEQKFSYDLHHSAFPMAGSLAALKRFADLKIPLYIISNGPTKGQCTRLEMAGMKDFFCQVYTSESFGAAKPSQAFFQQAFDLTQADLNKDLHPRQVLVIGDSWKADICGALEFGMPAIWLKTNRKFDPFEVEANGRVLEAENWMDILDCFPADFTMRSQPDSSSTELKPEQ